jgi:YggT family protein
MFVAGNFLGAVAEILGFALNAYMWVLIISALMSWVSPDPYNPIVRFIHAITDPLLDAIRRTLPFVAGAIDFSPMIAILLIMFTQRFLVQSLMDMAMRLH